MDQNFYYMGAKMTSAAFASSMENLNPSITLLLALMLRIEKLDIKSRHGKAKVIGSFLAIAGAFLMVFYRGPTIEFLWSEAREHQGNSNAVVQEEAKGAVVNFVVALFVEHGRVQPLILGWDKRLFAIIYSGIVCSGLSYVLLAIAMKEKGPVFSNGDVDVQSAAAFNSRAILQFVPQDVARTHLPGARLSSTQSVKPPPNAGSPT
ncbi:hypothetical protein HPP92_016395 [Vanilla planifolia]|uniref:WAT1-related protein n=1 Tax=Vanilla planifolia TaxID=51239 RepID=A0A835QFK1_VANPL|nr:hypothetical protein HPP92_016395 [Vanilla planifolia]